jgi:hypothetical protein
VTDVKNGHKVGELTSQCGVDAIGKLKTNRAQLLLQVACGAKVLSTKPTT